MTIAKIQIIQPGLMTSVQDAGRWGYQRFGVPVCGVRDQLARRFSNVLVGNKPNTALLEANMTGPTFKVLDHPVLIALTGSSQAMLRIGETSVSAQQSVLVHPGEEVSITPWGDSACICIAFGGGIDVPAVFGSASTYMRGKFGGFQGRALIAGDILNIGDSDQKQERVFPFSLPYGQGEFPVILGPQDDCFAQEAVSIFTENEYQVTMDCDRMGTRFDGESIPHKGDFNIVSDPMTLGSIQIPGNKRPIIMGPDRGTVGGYTKIGTLASTSLSRFSRLKPNDKVRFAIISPHQALSNLRSKEAMIRRMLIQFEEQTAR